MYHESQNHRDCCGLAYLELLSSALWKYSVYLSYYINMKFILPELTELTFEQRSLVGIDLDDPDRKWWGENLVVKGYGGTGKTVVACHRAMKLRKQDKKVLFLCFWKALTTFLSMEKLGYGSVYLQQFYRQIRIDLEKEIGDWFIN